MASSGDQIGDTILISALRGMGCEYEDDVQSFSQFTNHLVTHTLRTFIVLANPDAKLKAKLPNGAAARQRYCKRMGRHLSAMGYTGDTSYNQFLYPEEGQVRSLMRWVVNQIPRTTGGDTGGQGDTSGGVSGRVREALDAWRQQLWAPAFLSKRSHCQPFATVSLTTPDARPSSKQRLQYFNDFLPSASAQVRDMHKLAPSLLERNTGDVSLELEREADWSAADLDPVTHRAKKLEAIKAFTTAAFSAGVEAGSAIPGTRAAAAGLGGGLEDILAGYKDSAGSGTGTAFSHQADFGTERTGTGTEGDAGADEVADGAADSVETAAERERKDAATVAREREEELDNLERRIADAKTRSSQAASAAKDMTGRMRQLTAAITAARAQTDALERAYLVKKKTLEMLPEAATHIASLQKICSASAAKLVSLAAEWEKHRRPKIEAVRQHKESRSLRKEACKQKVADIKRMRTEMQAMAGDIRAKERRVVELREQFARMPKDLSRHTYTLRIMDIVKQLRKMKVEINKVIGNIREVQSQINTVTAKLKRTEALADEEVYQAARQSKDPAYIASYRHLSTLREIFGNLITIAEASGHAVNAQRDLEAKAEQLQASTSGRNMERLLADLEQVKKENADLKKALKAAA